MVVTRKEAPELFNAGPDDVVEVGPFQGTGLDLRSSPIMAIYAYPTVRSCEGGSRPEPLRVRLLVRRRLWAEQRKLASWYGWNMLAVLHVEPLHAEPKGAASILISAGLLPRSCPSWSSSWRARGAWPPAALCWRAARTWPRT